MRSVFELFAVTMGVCLAGVAAGCAAGSDPMEMASPPAMHSHEASKPELATAKEFCAARAKAECSPAVVSACGLTGESACVSARSKSCMSAVPQGTTYQPSKAQACLTAVTTAYATSQITSAALAALDPACGADLFAGPGKTRAPCMTDYDCDSAKGLHCVMPNPPPADNMGQCFVPQTVEPGGDCSGQGTVCGAGTYCDPTGLTCITDAQLGDGCNAPYYPCAAGLQCSASGSPFATCEAAAGDGADCNSDTECTSGLCDKATDQSGGTCTSTIMLSSLDSMCQAFQ